MTDPRETPFDQYNRTYNDVVQRSIRFSGQNHSYFLLEKVRHLLDLAGRHVSNPNKADILDVGCGVGLFDSFLEGHFGTLTGIDISAKSVEEAKRRNPWATYLSYDGETLPFADGSYDITLAVCVAHHVPPAQWSRFFSELHRVTRPGGIGVVFEHNPWNPLTRVAVASCEFDKDAVLLRSSTTRNLLASAGFLPLDSRFILFAPLRAKIWHRIESFMTDVPLGAQYLQCGRKA
jgi:SAM-dependent methyltransferase